jgi:hypothetical protein
LYGRFVSSRGWYHILPLDTSWVWLQYLLWLIMHCYSYLSSIFKGILYMESKRNGCQIKKIKSMWPPPRLATATENMKGWRRNNGEGSRCRKQSEGIRKGSGDTW